MMPSKSASGLERPAAILVETVQGEGGINVADFDWLKKIERLCREHDMPVRVFRMDQAGALVSIVRGGNEGTLIQETLDNDQ